MKTKEAKRTPRHLEQVKSSLSNMLSENYIQEMNNNKFNNGLHKGRFKKDYARNYDSYTLVDNL